MLFFLTDAKTGPQNVMLDLETWGTAPGSAIRSVGAVTFDPHTDELGAEFYMNVSDVSCETVGLTRDSQTVDWWLRQSKEAQQSLTTDQRHVREVVAAFHDWWREQRAVFVWSQGGNFDEPLWTAVCRSLGVRPPWKFYDARCTRTAYDLGGFDPRTLRRQGTYHNALDDAIHQARCVQAAYRKARARE